MNWTKVLILAFVLAGAVACGDDHDHDHDNNHDHNNHENNHNNHEGGAEEEACEHMADGPFESVTATADAMDAPSIAIEHTRVDVTLVDDGMGMYSGFVTFPAGEATEIMFFMSADVPVTVTGPDGMPVDAESTGGPSDLCPTDVLASAVYDVEVGTYTIEIGPTAEAEVGIVHEEAGAHSDEE